MRREARLARLIAIALVLTSIVLLWMVDWKVAIGVLFALWAKQLGQMADRLEELIK